MHKVLEMLHQRTGFLNSSKFFAGVMMILLNIGSKYITVKLSKSQEAYLRNYVLREVLIFAIVFTATKDIYISLILTAVFFVLPSIYLMRKARCVFFQKNSKNYTMYWTQIRTGK